MAIESNRSVYVVEFTSGTLKIGQTQRLKARMATHEQAARMHGHSIAKSWSSPAHAAYKANEEALISFSAARWDVLFGREYFTGADFDAIVAYAEELSFAEISADEVERTSCQGNALTGVEIRRRREICGKSAKALARELGISAVWVYRLESGRRVAGPDLARQLAEALKGADGSPAELLDSWTRAFNGHELRRRRELCGKSVVALAADADIRADYLYRIERGGQKPGALLIGRFARALQCEVADFLGDAAQYTPHTQLNLVSGD